MLDFYSIDKFDSFSEFLKEAILQERITKKLFSEKIGASYPIVNNWTSGKSIPKKDFRIRIAQYFNVYLEDINRLIEKQKRIVQKENKEKNKKYRNPLPTVDIIIENEREKIVLIERKNYPSGWALPGGFVEYGETLEHAAEREGKEETNLEIEIIVPFKAYSSPQRDPRFHTITYVFIARGEGELKGMDDAKRADWFSKRDIKRLDIAFDHGKIIDDYFEFKKRLKKIGFDLEDFRKLVCF